MAIDVLLRSRRLVVTMHRVCVSGVEPLLLSPPDTSGACPLGVNVAHRVSPAPSWQHQGLPEAAGAAIHGQH